MISDSGSPASLPGPSGDRRALYVLRSRYTVTPSRVLADIWKQGVQIEVSKTFACPKCGTKYILLIR